MESSLKLAVTQMTRAKKISVLFSNHDLPLLAKRHLLMVPVIGAARGCAPAPGLIWNSGGSAVSVHCAIAKTSWSYPAFSPFADQLVGSEGLCFGQNGKSGRGTGHQERWRICWIQSLSGNVWRVWKILKTNELKNTWKTGEHCLVSLPYLKGLIIILFPCDSFRLLFLGFLFGTRFVLRSVGVA